MKKSICVSIILVFIWNSYAHSELQSWKNKVLFIQPDHTAIEKYPQPSFTRHEIWVPFKQKGEVVGKVVFKDTDIDPKTGVGSGMYSVSVYKQNGKVQEVRGKKDFVWNILEIGTVDPANDDAEDIFFVCEDFGAVLYTRSLFILSPRSGKILNLCITFEVASENLPPKIERGVNFDLSDTKEESDFLEKIKSEYFHVKDLKQDFQLYMLKQYNAYSGGRNYR